MYNTDHVTVIILKVLLASIYAVSSASPLSPTGDHHANISPPSIKASAYLYGASSFVVSKKAGKRRLGYLRLFRDCPHNTAAGGDGGAARHLATLSLRAKLAEY